MDRAVPVGQCVRGWVVFNKPARVRPVSVTYGIRAIGTSKTDPVLWRFWTASDTGLGDEGTLPADATPSDMAPAGHRARPHGPAPGASQIPGLTAPHR